MPSTFSTTNTYFAHFCEQFKTNLSCAENKICNLRNCCVCHILFLCYHVYIYISYLYLQNAKKVYAKKAALATAMEDLQFHASGMLDEGDESLATLDEVLLFYL